MKYLSRSHEYSLLNVIIMSVIFKIIKIDFRPYLYCMACHHQAQKASNHRHVQQASTDIGGESADLKTLTN